MRQSYKGRTFIRTVRMLILACGVFYATAAHGQHSRRNFRVEGGVVSGPAATDTRIFTAADSLAADSLGITLAELEAQRNAHRGDSLRAARLAAAQAPVLSGRGQRRAARQERLADTTFVRHNWLFRDSIPISRVTAYSLILPGFSQLYNSQAWKVPVLYGTVGTSTYFWIREQRKYKEYRAVYEELFSQRDRNQPRSAELDLAQRRMIRQNTARQMLMITAFASYIYFLGDGVVNYPGASTSVKKATTLSTIFPGAGQFYNGSYWKIPIVIGGVATMAYMIDWNNRGYQRFKLAYRLATDGDPDTNDPIYTESYGADRIRTLKSSYRRNRDLCIILTGAFYLLNIVDAHADAHMKDYDISRDLTVSLEPCMDYFYTYSGRAGGNVFGMSLKLTF